MIGSLLLTEGTLLVWVKECRSVFAGTDEVNLEAKGVTLDVRVPITEENERAGPGERRPGLELEPAVPGAPRRRSRLGACRSGRAVPVVTTDS
jgi:hypothetical protein